MKKHLLLSLLTFVFYSGFSQGTPLPGGEYPSWLPSCDTASTIYLGSQSEVDNYPVDYSGQSIIDGCLVIVGQDIINLDSLYSITEINGNLFIGTISDCFPPPCLGNVMLSDLSGLQNLTIVNGGLVIAENLDLSNLDGLENINYNSMGGLIINGNSILSICSIESVCGYISLDSSYVDIENNLTGCNTQQEVEDACNPLSVNEIKESTIFIYPNPTKDFIYISNEDGLSINEINIYNQVGQKVYQIDNATDRIDVSSLKSGMYVVEVIAGKDVIREKVLVE